MEAVLNKNKIAQTITATTKTNGQTNIHTHIHELKISNFNLIISVIRPNKNPTISSKFIRSQLFFWWRFVHNFSYIFDVGPNFSSSICLW